MARKRTKKAEPAAVLDEAGAREFVRTLLKRLPDRRHEDDLKYVFDGASAVCAEPGKTLAWLGAYDLDPAISENAQLVIFFACESDLVAEPDREALIASAAEVAREAMRSPNVPDERKFRLAVILETTGDDALVQAVLSKAAQSPKTRERMVKEACKQVARAPQAIEGLLRSLGLIGNSETPPDESAVAFVAAIIAELHAENAEVAATLAGAIVVGAVNHGLAGAASGLLDDLQHLPSPPMLWSLQELGRWPGLGPVGVKAREIAAQPAWRSLQPAYSLQRRFSHGYVSTVDNTGSRGVTLFFLTPEGTMDGISLLCNMYSGLRDAWCVYDDADDLDSRLHDLSGLEEVALAHCSVALAREIIGDVWAIHEAQSRPLSASVFLYRPYLGLESIASKRREPDLTPYRLDALSPHVSLFNDDVDDLISDAAYAQLSFTSDKAYEFVAAHASKTGRNLPKKKREVFAREVAVEDRGRLLQLMAANLEVEALAGRAHYDINRQAARVWLGIKEEVLPFHEIPYIEALCALSTEMVLANIRAGYSNQAEVNAASLEQTMQGFEDDEDTGRWE